VELEHRVQDIRFEFCLQMQVILDWPIAGTNLTLYGNMDVYRKHHA